MAAGTKTGGRKAGTPNKLTYDTRQVLVNVLANEFEQLPELLAQLTPEARIDALCKLTKYALPTMQPTSALNAEREVLNKGKGMFDLII